MSAKISVNMSNFDVLSSCFECLCEQYPEAVNQAMMNVAQNILATANTLVPVRTGYLKSTIAIEQPSNFQLKLKPRLPMRIMWSLEQRKCLRGFSLLTRLISILAIWHRRLSSKSKIYCKVDSL